jgi:hypothetical protein
VQGCLLSVTGRILRSDGSLPSRSRAIPARTPARAEGIPSISLPSFHLSFLLPHTLLSTCCTQAPAGIGIPEQSVLSRSNPPHIPGQSQVGLTGKAAQGERETKLLAVLGLGWDSEQTECRPKQGPDRAWGRAGVEADQGAATA